MAEALDEKQAAMKTEMQMKRHALLDDVNAGESARGSFHIK